MSAIVAEADEAAVGAELLVADCIGSQDRVAALARCNELRDLVRIELLFVGRELAALDAEARGEWLSAAPANAANALRQMAALARRELSEDREKRLSEHAREVTARQARWHNRVTSHTFEHDGQTLTLAALDSFFDEPDVVRRRAGLGAGAFALAEVAPEFADDLESAIGCFRREQRERGRNDPRLKRIEEEGLELAEIEALHAAVISRTDQSQRWWSSQARRSGLPDFSYADRYAIASDGPVVPAMTADDALAASMDTLGAVHPDISNALRALNAGPSLDLSSRPEKRQDAFCEYLPGPVPSWVNVAFHPDHPHSTHALAHELGHAVHGALAAQNGWLALKLAGAIGEAMAVFAETLFIEHAGTNPRGALEQVILGVHRQTAMMEYEMRLHRAEAPLTATTISTAWIDATAPTFGAAVDLAGYEDHWILTPHAIAYPLYTFSYVYGALLALRLVELLKAEPRSGGATIAAMMRVGATRRPYEVAAMAGIDTTDPATWIDALAVIDKRMDAAGIEPLDGPPT
ncbi:hypothetical protein GKE82_23970 [Conexibacter sp. W3-3-2]|uniref:M3 family metallopeptidase n=1 Tax=Conexibacter sp. W3-3-2 TaxID=2675227 RepID=UPI0012B6F79C|nr:M3 family metallopeptidase [Conexibacter sp. W3-3-2]MTD47265.1 hypothetical protein [Conexibacter sp. W3-3-2]